MRASSPPRVVTQLSTVHLRKLAEDLQQAGHDPVILRGGMGARSRDAAIARLTPRPGGPPLLVAATGPYAGEGFDCPALDTLFLAAPVKWKGKLVQYAGRIMRPYPGKEQRRSTTITTPPPASWPPPCPAVPPATSAWAFPTPARSPLPEHQPRASGGPSGHPGPWHRCARRRNPGHDR